MTQDFNTTQGCKAVPTELERKLYLACHHAFLWMCGNGNEQSEIDTMKVLEEAIEAYREIG